MKKGIVIAILAVLLLGGGGAAAWFFIFNKPAEAAGGPVDEAAKAEHDAKVADAEHGAPAAETQFVHLDPITLPVIDESGVTQSISLVISLEVPDSSSAIDAQRMFPRLKDAYIMELYGYLNRKNSMENGVLKVSMIKSRLGKITTRVLGDNKFNDVLLQVVQQNGV